MNNTNKLVSSDNVGYAAILFEKQLNPGAYVGHGKVVTAFASANLGDSSPNINGPKCEYSGLPCDLLTSTCHPNEGACFASGPGRDQFESCRIIGARIHQGAKELLEKNTARELSGPINFIHQFIDMSTARAKFLNTTTNQFEEVMSSFVEQLGHRLDFNQIIFGFYQIGSWMLSCYGIQLCCRNNRW